MVEDEVFEYAQIYLELINVLPDDEVDELLLLLVIDVDAIDDEMGEHSGRLLIVDVLLQLVEVDDEDEVLAIDEIELVDYW